MAGKVFTVVTVGLAAPATPGSSESTVLKLEPETLAWLDTLQTPAGNGESMVALNRILKVELAGTVTGPVVTVSPDIMASAPF